MKATCRSLMIIWHPSPSNKVLVDISGGPSFSPQKLNFLHFHSFTTHCQTTTAANLAAEKSFTFDAPLTSSDSLNRILELPPRQCLPSRAQFIPAVQHHLTPPICRQCQASLLQRPRNKYPQLNLHLSTFHSNYEKRFTDSLLHGARLFPVNLSLGESAQCRHSLIQLNQCL
jgi:hypothetical protein